ncbi:MAG: hypothetical protein LBI82_06345, partial [Dysgonamonadaceae bacterium]|nr:hypothetical protein [Dysgonamonadaceae bacterium]
MSNTLCRKSVYIVVFSIITTFHLSAQEKNELFKQLIKESFKDLMMEPLKPETMMPDSLRGNIKLDLNKNLPFTEKKQLTISENLFKPYTNPSKPHPSRTGTFNTITNKITFDKQLPSSGGNIGGKNLDI